MKKEELIDFKIDLILLNQSNCNDFEKKYSESKEEAFFKINIITFFEDFLYINNQLCTNMINALKLINYKKEYPILLETINDIDREDSIKIEPRRNAALINFYKELKNYLETEKIEENRLKEIYDAHEILFELFKDKQNKYLYTMFKNRLAKKEFQKVKTLIEINQEKN